MTFKKNYFEHIMLADDNCHFPISLFTIHIKEMMTDLDVNEHPGFKNFAYLFNNELTYAFMSNALLFWMGSKAEHGDCPTIFKLLDSLLEFCDEHLQTDTFESLLIKLSEINYVDFKRYQLNKIKEKKRKNWGPLIKDFDKTIAEEVRSFVQDQRFLELSKGSWVHTYNPLEAPPKNSTKLPYYFITLSSNNKALIYKEFSKKQDSAIVNVDMDGNKIEFTSILKIQADSMTKSQTVEEANATKLIDINSRLQVSKIMIILKDSRIFEFYVSNQKLLYVWLDGLNMLINENSELSDDTKYQIESLIKVRTDVQLINLPDTAEDMDVVVPDINELSALTSGFYYA
ncbi:unnamed protein product [Ambrosiozyma monospora]|uniref:Unnamed protein product n=1 Tax=Ambrosiozyma monospora TaxID=43982 RepID=A0ACB5T2X6_AMBMO|nr:unnamed protein product [Ambrosiozyma monospora]